MPSKRRKPKRLAKRQAAQEHSPRQTLILIAAVAVLVVAVVAVLVFLEQSSGPSTAGAEEVSLDKSYGAEDAPVVVVEYSDFQCPYCKLFAEGAGRQVREEYADQGKVRFVYRHFAFIGPESTWAAEASECANEQGRFWDYHDTLFEEQGDENQGAFSKENLKRFAAELGLDTAQFDECFDSGRYESRVRDEVNEAQRRRIASTPSLLVNGQYLENGASYQVLQAAIESALAGQ